MLYQIISNKKKQYIVLFLVDLCNMGFHSAAVQKCAQHHQPINHPSSLSCCNFDWVNSQDLMFASGEMRAVCFNEIQ